MPKTITLTGSYGYQAYRYGGDADIIDASDATWIMANTGGETNRYPFLIDGGAAGVEIFGATIDGRISHTASWEKTYINSAALMVRDTKNATVRDIEIDGPWDGVRIAGKSAGFEIRDVLVTDARDDAVENDDGNSGAIRDSLFDGVFSGISLGNKNTPDRSNAVVEIDGVLMRMESYLYKGEMTHGSPMKMTANSPSLKITNSVFAIEDVNHFGDQRLELAWDKTLSSSGNTFLNLSDDPLPKGYPLPPSGWTVIEGAAARKFWADSRSDWLASRGQADDAPTPRALATVDTQESQDREKFDIVGEAAPEPVIKREAMPEIGNGITKSESGTYILDSTVLKSLRADRGSDTLDRKFFEVAARADDGDDYLMYKWRTGEVFYDADGNGDGKQVKIAQLEARLSLDHTDFLVGKGDTATFRSAGTTPDSTRATGQADTLKGTRGADRIDGKGGDDTLIGGRGDDRLTGGDGADSFVFDTKRGTDTITDFDPDIDKIVLDASTFTKLDGEGNGVLDRAQFKIAARAEDSDDYIMYKWKTGELFYDADGRGSGDAIQIAQLGERLALSHDDFLII